MASFVKEFGETEVGKKESRWRKSIARNNSGNNAGGNNAGVETVSMGGDDNNETHSNADRECSLENSGGVFSPEQKADFMFKKTQPLSPKDSTLESTSNASVDLLQSLDSNYHFYLNNGEHLGGECILNGTPMDSTVMACGEVTCFILTRTDLISLFNETHLNEHLRMKSNYLDESQRSGSAGRDRGEDNSTGSTGGAGTGAIQYSHLGSYVGAQPKVLIHDASLYSFFF
jgi:hypothetical protein